jgi:predicted RNase H-like nuclease (RuvC/YqgF family)
MVTTKNESKEFYKMIDELENKKVHNDLEEQIRVLTFRNEKLHQHNAKIEQQIIELREDNKKLARQVEDSVGRLRKAGII